MARWKAANYGRWAIRDGLSEKGRFPPLNAREPSAGVSPPAARRCARACRRSRRGRTRFLRKIKDLPEHLAHIGGAPGQAPNSTAPEDWRVWVKAGLRVAVESAGAARSAAPSEAAAAPAPRHPFGVDGGRAAATIGGGGVRRRPRGWPGRREAKVRRDGARTGTRPPAGRKRAGRTTLGLGDRRADREEFSSRRAVLRGAHRGEGAREPRRPLRRLRSRAEGAGPCMKWR
jgi:hypothetical protein